MRNSLLVVFSIALHLMAVIAGMVFGQYLQSDPSGVGFIIAAILVVSAVIRIFRTAAERPEWLVRVLPYFWSLDLVLWIGVAVGYFFLPAGSIPQGGL